MSWKLVAKNDNMYLWEGIMPNGVAIRLPSPDKTQPFDFFLDYHESRWGTNVPKCELGKRRGYRLLMPDETKWREYGYR